VVTTSTVAPERFCDRVVIVKALLRAFVQIVGLWFTRVSSLDPLRVDFFVIAGRCCISSCHYGIATLELYALLHGCDVGRGPFFVCHVEMSPPSL
jgi:hypothetical protein